MPQSEQTGQREVSRVIQEWLISILRFAITLDEIDRAAVLAVAADMDHRDSGFTFFGRTSIKICDAVVAKDHAEAIAELRVFVRVIEHVRLRRAFEAVLPIKPPEALRHMTSARNRKKLWQGLPARTTGTASWR